MLYGAPSGLFARLAPRPTGLRPPEARPWAPRSSGLRAGGVTSTSERIGASSLRSGRHGRHARTRWSAWSETHGRIRRTTHTSPATRILPVLCPAPLCAEVGLGSSGGPSPVGENVASAQSMAPVVLELPQEPVVVRTATGTNATSDGLRRPRREGRSGEPGAENPPAGFCGGRTAQGQCVRGRPLPITRIGDTRRSAIFRPPSSSGGGGSERIAFEEPCRPRWSAQSGPRIAQERFRETWEASGTPPAETTQRGGGRRREDQEPYGRWWGKTKIQEIDPPVE
jgi:hypothetical protein